MKRCTHVTKNDTRACTRKAEYLVLHGTHLVGPMCAAHAHKAAAFNMTKQAV